MCDQMECQRAIATKNMEIGDLQRELFAKATKELPVDPDAPEGSIPIVAYVTADGEEIVVLEQKGLNISDTEDENDERYHNCDAMGCSSVSHVFRRFQIA